MLFFITISIGETDLGVIARRNSQFNGDEEVVGFKIIESHFLRKLAGDTVIESDPLSPYLVLRKETCTKPPSLLFSSSLYSHPAKPYNVT